MLGRGGTWLDTGNIRDFYDASNYISAIENRQGLKIACPEEIAFRMGFICPDQLRKQIRTMPKSSYRDYLKELIARETN